VDRRAGGRVVGEDLDEAAAVRRGVEHEVQDLADAGADERRLEQQLALIDQHASGGGDRAGSERPRAGLAAGCEEAQALVTAELLRGLRRAATAQVVG